MDLVSVKDVLPKVLVILISAYMVTKGDNERFISV